MGVWHSLKTWWRGKPEQVGQKPGTRPAATVPAPKFKYEAARNTTTNREIFRNADGSSATAANCPETRRVLRNRARYEDANNGYANGLTGDRANETIGTGPRLQIAFPEDETESLDAGPEDKARAVERRWNEWCQAVGLLDKLLVMDESETREGEVFAFKFFNPALPETGPQLDVRLYEADQVATPDLLAEDPNAVDGIRFDQAGNPVEYHVLKRHPGDTYSFASAFEYDKVPARQMIHWFKPRRAGQARGIPAFQSSLPLYSILRRYTLASLQTAEAQARITGVVKNQNRLPGSDDGTDDGDEGGDQIEFAGVTLLELDAGQDAHEFKTSQPAPEYPAFKGEVLTEAGRPINAPRNVSRGTSADYNYSSGRLDQQQWQRAIRIRRARLERIVLDNLFAEWLREARMIPGYLPADLPPVDAWQKRWRWDGFVSIDPVKDADAATMRLANGTSSLDRECGELGEDWEDVQDQRLREEVRLKRRRAALGLPAEQPVAPRPSGGRVPPGEDKTDG